MGAEPPLIIPKNSQFLLFLLFFAALCRKTPLVILIALHPWSTVSIWTLSRAEKAKSTDCLLKLADWTNASAMYKSLHPSQILKK